MALRSPARRWILVVVLAALVRGVSPAAAQEPPTDAPRNVLIPLPIIFYTPETRLGFGAALSYIYRAPGSSIDSRPSSFNGTVIFTTRSQILAAFGANHYWGGERHQVSGGVLYRKFPDEFFGIGNDTPDTSESYTDEGPAVSLDYLFRVVTGLRAGMGLVYAASSITETQSGDQLASGVVPGSDGGQAAGAKLRLNFDYRDNINNPRSGGYYDLSWRVFGSWLGADVELNGLTLDLRQYLYLGRRSMIALRALGSSTGGIVPFQLMPKLGGQNLMRGYYEGRFRDRKAVAAQAELRFGPWERFGGVLFGSLGQVADRAEQIAADRFRHVYGFGLRFLLVRQESLSLRFDWGFGKDQSGFYFSLGEAF
jgi:outer membrane protein assembly factor BamA